MKLLTLLLLAVCNYSLANPPQRAAFLEGAPNFRDLGGYACADGKQTAWQKIYRSQTLANLTDADHAVLHEIGIKTVIDFRSDEELQQSPSRLPEGLTVIHLPIDAGNVSDSTPSIMQRLMNGEIDSLQAIFFMEEANRHFATDFAPQYKAFFSILANPDAYPLVFHCTAGKDRTGFAAAMILSTLGVSWDTIMEDYLLTNTYLKPSSIVPQMPDKALPAMRQLWSVKPSYLNAALDEIVKRYGSLDDFLQKELGLGDAEKEALKKIMGVL